MDRTLRIGITHLKSIMKYNIFDDDKIDMTLCFVDLLPTKLASSVQIWYWYKKGTAEALARIFDHVQGIYLKKYFRYTVGQLLKKLVDFWLSELFLWWRLILTTCCDRNQFSYDDENIDVHFLHWRE